MRERRYGAKGERACKPNCKFSVGWIIGILIGILISIRNFLGKVEEGKRGRCRSAYKYSYKSTYKYLEIFSEEGGDLWKGRRGRGRGFPRFFVGFRPGRQLVSRLTIRLVILLIIPRIAHIPPSSQGEGRPLATLAQRSHG